MTILAVLLTVVNIISIFAIAILYVEGYIDIDTFLFTNGFKVKHLLLVFILPVWIVAVIISLLYLAVKDNRKDKFWNKRLF